MNTSAVLETWCNPCTTKMNHLVPRSILQCCRIKPRPRASEGHRTSIWTCFPLIHDLIVYTRLNCPNLFKVKFYHSFLLHGAVLRSSTPSVGITFLPVSPCCLMARRVLIKQPLKSKSKHRRSRERRLGVFVSYPVIMPMLINGRERRGWESCESQYITLNAWNSSW